MLTFQIASFKYLSLNRQEGKTAVITNFFTYETIKFYMIDSLNYITNCRQLDR